MLGDLPALKGGSVCPRAAAGSAAGAHTKEQAAAERSHHPALTASRGRRYRLTPRMRPLRTLAALALCLAGCGGEEEPVARLAVEPRQVRLPYPQVADMRLHWEPATDLGRQGAGGPYVFVHLLDAPGEIVRTFDHAMPEPWREGIPATYRFELYQSALGPPLPPGTYRLTLGLYDGRSRKRWPLAAPGPDLGRHEYHVADVEVPPVRPGGVRFSFSPEWTPSEAGGDRQILGRRWLASRRGTLRATGLEGPGTLWTMVRIPAAAAGHHLQVLDGSNAPSAVLRWSCGGMETGVSGAGSHEIELITDEPPPGGACEVEVSANFFLAAAGSAERRSVGLENVAWNPAEP